MITYQPDPARQRIVTEDFTSQGRPWQTHRLSRPLQLSETAQPSDLEPNLEILDPKPEIPDPKEPEKGVPWEFVPRFLDMAAEALQYTVEPWQNAIRFGNGIYGKVPVLGARVRIAYHQNSRRRRQYPGQERQVLILDRSKRGRGPGHRPVATG